MSDEKPKLTLDLRGSNGNVYAVIAAVRGALIDAGMLGEAREFSSRALLQGSYENILEYCKQYVDVTYVR